MLQPDPTGTGTFVAVPREVNAELGLKGRPKINSVIAGHPYRGSLMPLGDGTFCLGVLKSIQESAGVKRGDTITVELELDTAPREVTVPLELAAALDADPAAKATFEKLSYSNKSWHALQVTGTNNPETRARRIEKSIAALRDGRIR